MVIELLGVVALAVALSGALTARVRSYAIARSLLDHPNHRSSHEIPTPRGGGLAIAFVVLAAAAALFLTDRIEPALAVSLLGGGGLVASVGWLDDLRSRSAVLRLTAHLVAAVWAVFWIGSPRELGVGGLTISLGILAPVLTAFCLVWLTNLFNFMDGIDGLAGAEAAVVGALGGGLLIYRGEIGAGTLALAISAAAVGFLVHNWPPARIFMGDSGSCFLGYVIGVLALFGDRSGATPLGVWILLLGVFLFDATVTLIRRIGREPIHRAHRLHAYQRAVQAGLSHRAVTLRVLALDLLLGALALAALAFPGRLPLLLLVGAAVVTLAYLQVERRRPMWAAHGERRAPKQGPLSPPPADRRRSGSSDEGVLIEAGSRTLGDAGPGDPGAADATRRARRSS